MKTIHKYPLEGNHTRLLNDKTLILPYGAQPIHLDHQRVDFIRGQGLHHRHDLTLWCIVDNDPKLTQCKVPIEVVGTGHPLPSLNSHNYIGSSINPDTNEVRHVFMGPPTSLGPVPQERPQSREVKPTTEAEDGGGSRNSEPVRNRPRGFA